MNFDDLTVKQAKQLKENVKKYESILTEPRKTFLTDAKVCIDSFNSIIKSEELNEVNVAIDKLVDFFTVAFPKLIDEVNEANGKTKRAPRKPMTEEQKAERKAKAAATRAKNKKAK